MGKGTDMNWQAKLPPAAVRFMTDIIAQVPEAGSARTTFEMVLNQIAGEAAPFRFLVFNEDSLLLGGTNNPDLRDRIEGSAADWVVDVLAPDMQELDFEDLGFDEDDEDDEEDEEDDE